MGGGLHLPGMGNTDAASEAVKARATAVLKREEAATVRSFSFATKLLLAIHFSIMTQARVSAINARLRALGQDEWHPSSGSPVAAK